MERGAIATLKVPYLGYRRIELIEPYGNQWLVRIAKAARRLPSMKTSSS